MSDFRHPTQRQITDRQTTQRATAGPKGASLAPPGAGPIQRQTPPNSTGLPDELKSGIESLSGHSLDDVKVHYNSAKPAQLNAHAYAQGTNIHLASGQEQHLPHEAWHVVQQKQGRVQPTMQMNGAQINDNPGLEKEADVMGSKAVSPTVQRQSVTAKTTTPAHQSQVTQRVIQRGITKNTTNKKKTTKKKPKSSLYMGAGFKGSPPVVNVIYFGSRPPSNSRSGQGDHIVAYTLIQHAIASEISNKKIDDAANGLVSLIQHSQYYVGSGFINKWWHTAADNLITKLQNIDPNKEAAAKIAFNQALNDIAVLMNTMPGSTVKNAKSTKGHGEDVKGLLLADKKRKKGNVINGNPWVNILKLIDLNADKQLVNNPTKLEKKVQWLMTLVSHTIPTLYQELEANYQKNKTDADLITATTQAYSPLVAIEVQGIIEDFMAS